jgi:tellurite resistance protein TerC
MLEVTPVAWAATVAFVLALFALDLVTSRRPHAMEFRAAVAWSVFYLVVALAFGAVFGVMAGWQFGAEYVAGYIVERSLSMDNLFVFVIILSTFAVPAEHQQRVLTFGILLALVFRVIFILLGAALLNLFSFMFLVFGVLLIVTAVQLFRHREEDPSVEDNTLVNLSRRVLPITPGYEGGRIVTRHDRRWMVTPLFLVLVAIGSTDILFALDSIPAVFGVTQETFIVVAANAFALLGLRSLYFLVSGLLDRLVYLSTGLALVLVFIGVKLILDYLHEQDSSFPEISISLSLGVIVVVLAVTAAASMAKSRRDPSARAHAGSLLGHDDRNRSDRQKP